MTMLAVEGLSHAHPIEKRQADPSDSRLCPQARPIRVCFISPLGGGLYTAGKGYSGGAELQFYLLSHALAEDPEFGVTVLVTEPGAPHVDFSGKVQVIRRQGQARLGHKQPSLFAWPKLLWRSFDAFREMRTWFRTIDADVFLHAGAGVEVGAYAIISRLMARRFVFVVASSGDLMGHSQPINGPLRWLYPLGVRLADAVICRSEDQRTLLQQRFHRSGVVIKTAHPPVTNPVSSRERTERTSLLWVGRLGAVKQPELFVEVARQIPSERCVMVLMHDTGQGEILQRLRMQAAALPNLTIRENVAWGETGAYFREAKVLVNTSDYEGFPNTFVQAAMHGTPILSLTVDPDEVLTRYQIGACASGSFERLTELVFQFAGSASLRTEYGERAQTYAEKHHAIDQSLAQLRTFIQSMVKRRG